MGRKTVYAGEMFEVVQWEGRPGVTFEAVVRAPGVRLLIEWVGKVVQAPYNTMEAGVKKVAWVVKNGAKAWAEAIWNIPQVQRLTEPAWRLMSEWMEKLSDRARGIIATTKERANEVLALAATPILVGSKDWVEGSGKLRSQLGAVGNNIWEIKPFWTQEAKVDSLAQELQGVDIKSRKSEQKELGFDIANNPVYKEFPFLEKHAEALWDLKPSDVISDIWTQAIIVKSQRLNGTVAKVERPDAQNKLVDEFNLHNEAYNIWKKWRKERLISENIYIPKVGLPAWVDRWIMLMEQVYGQSLHTKSLIENAYKNVKGAMPLTQLEKDIAFRLPDGDAKKYIMEKYDITSADAFRVIELYSVDQLWPYLYDRSRPTVKTDLTKALEYLQKEPPGIIHKDMHPWNIMVTNDEKIYIIDWWRARILNPVDPPKP